jgi:hypothetical protein
MSASDRRILKPEHLPRHLWDPDHEQDGERGLLGLPPALVAAHSAVIQNDTQLQAVPPRAASDSPVGGVGDDETRTHFVQAFDGSCARCLLAILDPKSEVIFSSNRLVRSLAGNTVCFTDAPCGAGAAFASFLTALADLRLHGVLPRVPLDVKLIGADVSPLARNYALRVLTEIRSTLADQAIFVQEDFVNWDVLSQQSNMDLIRKIILGSHQREKKLLSMANFTDFLISKNQYSAAEAQLIELFRYCAVPGGSAIWIEPSSNLAVRPKTGLFARIKVLFTKALQLFGAVETGDHAPDDDAKTSARFRLSLHHQETSIARLAVVPIQLEPQAAPPA